MAILTTPNTVRLLHSLPLTPAPTHIAFSRWLCHISFFSPERSHSVGSNHKRPPSDKCHLKVNQKKNICYWILRIRMTGWFRQCHFRGMVLESILRWTGECEGDENQKVDISSLSQKKKKNPKHWMVHRRSLWGWVGGKRKTFVVLTECCVGKGWLEVGWGISGQYWCLLPRDKEIPKG